MKKIASIVVFGLIVSMTAAFAYSGSYTPMDIAGVISQGKDDQHIVMEGKFIKHERKDKYVFQDKSGQTIIAEVDDDCGAVKLDVAVRAYGEIDIKHGKIKLEIERIESL